VATVLDTDANTKLVDAQASTAKSNLPGYYEYEYSGADNLDLVCLFHTSDTGTDQQDLVSYVVEKVYQADAKLDVIDGIVDAILVDTGTTLPAEINAVYSDVMNATVEGAYTVQEVLRIMAGALAGKLSGGGTTTLTFRDLSDTLDRITATVNTTTGDRTAVTIDKS
jgi:hypothetical protein